MVCQPPEAAIEQPDSGDTRCYAYGNEPTTRTARQRVRDELEHRATHHGTRSEAREHWHPREHTSLVEAECKQSQHREGAHPDDGNGGVDEG
jgi:hypothetical protein